MNKQQDAKDEKEAIQTEEEYGMGPVNEAPKYHKSRVSEDKDLINVVKID